MKSLLLLLVFVSVQPALAVKKREVKKSLLDIGPVYAEPVSFGKKIYFLSAMGKLYESDPKLTTHKIIFQTDRPSMSGVTKKGAILYFGDGLHKDNKSALYAFDLKKKVLYFKKTVEGHIERPPLVFKNLVITGLGPAGVAAFNRHSGDLEWHTRKYLQKELHVDSKLVTYKDRLIASSIYKYKALLGIEISTGEIKWSTETPASIKSTPIVTKKSLYALAFEANAIDSKLDDKSFLLTINPNSGQIIKKDKLRGHNFFSALQSSDFIWIGLSAGDLFKLNTKSGRLTYVDHFESPLLSSPFRWKGSTCIASSFGQLRCYKGKKKTLERKLDINVIGDVAKIKGRYYLPSRTGYLSLKTLNRDHK